MCRTSPVCVFSSYAGILYSCIQDSTAAFKVLEGPIGEELAQRFAKVQMVPLGWWDNGIRHITNSKRPIVKPADLKGLKIRTPPDPMTIDIFQALGAGTEWLFRRGTSPLRVRAARSAYTV